MSEISKLPGDIKTRQTFDPKTKVLHVEPVKVASVGWDITQEEWDRIFKKDYEEEDESHQSCNSEPPREDSID